MSEGGAHDQSQIFDLPEKYPLKNEVIQWEKQFWEKELEKGVYEAGVDTTFALYKPGSFEYTIHPSIRTGDPFTARHMPWYSDLRKPSKEDIFYKNKASKTITSWNVDKLPERYKKELGKQG